MRVQSRAQRAPRKGASGGRCVQSRAQRAPRKGASGGRCVQSRARRVPRKGASGARCALDPIHSKFHMPAHGIPGMWLFKVPLIVTMLRSTCIAILLLQAVSYAQSEPQPPCGEAAVPPYPGLDSSPNVKFWSESGFGRDWRPPACTGWAAAGFSTLVTTAARFRYDSGTDGLLRHIGAISELAGMRYWSTTHQRWQTLIVSAYALTGRQSGHRRQDFTPDEMQAGALLYLEEADNLSGSAIYRMHIAEASADRLVFDLENVSVMRYFFVTLFPAGEMQSIYFLDRESADIWRYYSIARTGRNASRLATGHESSSINRAVAFYRSLAGIPTDQEPPAAR